MNLEVSDPGSVGAAVRVYALSLPGAHEDFPWGESVVKVGTKVFVFLGRAGEGDFGLSVKLPSSARAVLTRPGAVPTAYGLGRAGWVSVSFPAGTTPDLDELCAWVRESYRAVAPKRLGAQVVLP